MLTDQDIQRYARQILLPEVGGKGQQALARARVLCVGTGGLGCPASLYLAAAGVGTLGLADGDPVDLSNLHRQVLHFTPDVGRSKTSSAAEKLASLNPTVKLELHGNLSGPVLSSAVGGYDLVLDGSDNFETRYAVNDACVAVGKPLVSGAVLKWEGQLLTVLPGISGCYRCAFPEPPDPACTQTCSEAGILGPVAGVIGAWMALEAVKVLLKAGASFTDRLWSMDFLAGKGREVPFRRRVGCGACGK
jgi:molybdopterin-synthase adenylyltransferase